MLSGKKWAKLRREVARLNEGGERQAKMKKRFEKDKRETNYI